ncbi:MAG: PIG-L family deacetylase [Phycisphaeraceae bacterium]|nr:PIG-L family deacetylase [Phycisphaeraceae bacterium]
MRIVSIMAHQDDEMRCLGAMLKCQARGDQLAFVTLTDGSAGFVQQPDIPRAQAAQIRHDEMARLAHALGAQFINLQEQDEYLYDTPEVRRAVIEAIRQTRADLIFTHYHEDYNQDHITTHDLVRHCAMQSCLPVIPTASPPLASHPAVFTVLPHGPFLFPATHFVDVTDFEARKIELLLHHQSQETAMRAAVGQGFEGLCRRPDAYWGDQVGCPYAECFAPMRGRGAIKPFNVLP